MPQIDSRQELVRLSSLYSQKNDEELLALWTDVGSLTEVAQGALRAEMDHRKLSPGEVDLPPTYSAEPAASQNFILSGIRGFGFLLLNLIVAVFGTAIFATLIGHFYHPQTISAVLIKSDSLSAICGFALGFFVSRRWKLYMARWTALVGLVWFTLGACIDISHGTVWSRMSGIACGEGLHANHCMEWLVFSLPALRTVFYSAGAWMCWRLSAYGTTSTEDAVLGRFKVPQTFRQD